MRRGCPRGHGGGASRKSLCGSRLRLTPKAVVVVVVAIIVALVSSHYGFARQRQKRASPALSRTLQRSFVPATPASCSPTGSQPGSPPLTPTREACEERSWRGAARRPQ